MTEGEALRVLHLDPDCSREQIRQAYTDLVKVWHPDRFQGDARLRADDDQFDVPGPVPGGPGRGGRGWKSS